MGTGRVIIVGAGIRGLTAALGLARSGRCVDVLERDPLPDVSDRLLAAGCATMPTTAQLREPRPGDEDLPGLSATPTDEEPVPATTTDRATS